MGCSNFGQIHAVVSRVTILVSILLLVCYFCQQQICGSRRGQSKKILDQNEVIVGRPNMNNCQMFSIDAHGQKSTGWDGAHTVVGRLHEGRHIDLYSCFYLSPLQILGLERRGATFSWMVNWRVEPLLFGQLGNSTT